MVSSKLEYGGESEVPIITQSEVGMRARFIEPVDGTLTARLRGTLGKVGESIS